MFASTNSSYVFMVTKTKVMNSKNSENCISVANLYVTSRMCTFLFLNWLQQNNLMQSYYRAVILQWGEKKSKILGEFHKEQLEVLLIIRDSTHCHQNLKVHWFIPPHLSTQGIFKYSAASRTLAKHFNTS